MANKSQITKKEINQWKFCNILTAVQKAKKIWIINDLYFFAYKTN